MYLVVGGWNSVFAYACFVLLYYLLHEILITPVILTISYAVGSINGYLTFRYLVFAPARRAYIEYLRYQAVYLPILGFNLVALPLALRYTTLNAYAAQALLGVVAVVVAYIGNKYYAFRKPSVGA
jgi:putative flippase GtrA